MTIDPAPGPLDADPEALEAANEVTARGVAEALAARPWLRALNNLIKRIKRIGFGFRNFRNYYQEHSDTDSVLGEVGLGDPMLAIST